VGWWFFDCRKHSGPAGRGKTAGYWCIEALPSGGDCPYKNSLRTNCLAIAMLVFASMLFAGLIRARVMLGEQI